MCKRFEFCETRVFENAAGKERILEESSTHYAENFIRTPCFLHFAHFLPSVLESKLRELLVSQTSSLWRKKDS